MAFCLMKWGWIPREEVTVKPGDGTSQTISRTNRPAGSGSSAF